MTSEGAIVDNLNVIFCSGAEAILAPANLIYRQDDPYAVSVKLGALLFDVSREVLMNGGGSERIEVEIAENWVRMTLVGEHSILFRRPEVERFVLKSLLLVPAGNESQHVDWDSELANIGLDEC